jgi:hypothetical protein
MLRTRKMQRTAGPTDQPTDHRVTPIYPQTLFRGYKYGTHIQQSHLNHIPTGAQLPLAILRRVTEQNRWFDFNEIVRFQLVVMNAVYRYDFVFTSTYSISKLCAYILNLVKSSLCLPFVKISKYFHIKISIKWIKFIYIMNLHIFWYLNICI